MEYLSNTCKIGSVSINTTCSNLVMWLINFTKYVFFIYTYQHTYQITPLAILLHWRSNALTNVYDYAYKAILIYVCKYTNR